MSRRTKKNNNRNRRRNFSKKKLLGGMYNSINTDQIEKLSELKDKDMITNDEFVKAKQQLLQPNNFNTSRNSGGFVSNIVSSIVGTGGDSSDGLIKKGIKTAFTAATWPARFMFNTAKSVLGVNHTNNVASNNNPNMINNSMNHIQPGSKVGGDINCVDQLDVVCNNCSQPNQLLELHNNIVNKLKNTNKGLYDNDVNQQIDNLSELNVSRQSGGKKKLTRKRKKQNRKNKSKRIYKK